MDEEVERCEEGIQAFSVRFDSILHAGLDFGDGHYAASSIGISLNGWLGLLRAELFVHLASVAFTHRLQFFTT